MQWLRRYYPLLPWLAVTVGCGSSTDERFRFRQLNYEFVVKDFRHGWSIHAQMVAAEERRYKLPSDLYAYGGFDENGDGKLERAYMQIEQYSCSNEFKKSGEDFSFTMCAGERARGLPRPDKDRLSSLYSHIETYLHGYRPLTLSELLLGTGKGGGGSGSLRSLIPPGRN